MFAAAVSGETIPIKQCPESRGKKHVSATSDVEQVAEQVTTRHQTAGTTELLRSSFEDQVQCSERFFKFDSGEGRTKVQWFLVANVDENNNGSASALDLTDETAASIAAA